jgi:hypothetical protein
VTADNHKKMKRDDNYKGVRPCGKIIQINVEGMGGSLRNSTKARNSSYEITTTINEHELITGKNRN